MHSVEQKQYTISQYLFALCTVITIKNLITRIILLQSVSFSQQLGKLSALRSVREMWTSHRMSIHVGEMSCRRNIQ